MTRGIEFDVLPSGQSMIMHTVPELEKQVKELNSILRMLYEKLPDPPGRLDPNHDFRPIQMDVTGKLLGVKVLEEKVHDLEDKVKVLVKAVSTLKPTCFEDYK